MPVLRQAPQGRPQRRISKDSRDYRTVFLCSLVNVGGGVGVREGTGFA